MKKSDPETDQDPNNPKGDIKHYPKISVITATYNSAETIEDCLGSMQAQTWTNREHIVIDGASTDGTLSILSRNRAHIDRIISEKDSGIYNALNKGIRHASGDIVGFLHSDDVFSTPKSLEIIASAFNDPNVCATYGSLDYVDQKDPTRIVRRWNCKSYTAGRLKRGWMPPHPTLYVRREWFSSLAGFDESYKIAADYKFILKAFSHPQFVSTNTGERLIKMRTGGASNASTKQLLKKYKEDFRALRDNHYPLHQACIALIMKNLTKVVQLF